MTKSELRREAKLRLERIPAEEREARGDRAAANVWALPEIAAARVILTYASTFEEVPTDGIAAEARRRGIELVYPRCLLDRSELTLHSVRSPDVLVNGAFGLREPDPGCPLIDLAMIDVALIPGLAWDRQGHRLGRGAGYYDRLLRGPEWRAIRCGLFFAAQEAESIPVDPWDSPLDAVVTEDETLRFAQRQEAPA
jgi:5-formyltetrahydrofolate cyclo-ligase